MPNFVVVLTVALASGFATASFAQDVSPPAWAYPMAPQAAQPATAAPAAPPPVDATPKHVPNSDVALTLAQTRDLFTAPDWHPGDHPTPPDIVLRGRKPGVFACGFCHLPNGLGRPENASIGSLPAAYIAQQLADFKSGVRKSSDPRMAPPNLMINVAKNINDDEIKAAAAYFASLKLTPWIKVLEASTAPKTRVTGGMFAALDDGSKEPIGNRIVEVPMNLSQTELRDSESGFIAYVPPGSIKKGEALAKGGKGFQCAACHGQDLKGLGPVPPLAGRSPTYLMRQLFDIKHGNREGSWSPLMKQVVDKLSEDDMLNLVAYAASRTP